MNYFTCLSCPPHSTLDHDLHGKGGCLFPDCPCKKMEPGPVYIKPVYVKQSQEEATKAAAERGKLEEKVTGS